MIGQPQFEINSEELMRGMTSSPYTEDGGFSNETEGVNLTKTPGLMYFSAEKVDQTDELTGTLVASCEDPTVFSGTPTDRMFVDDDGNYYKWNGTLLDKVGTDGTNPTKYPQGKVDMAGFGGNYVYTTNEVGVIEWIVSSNTFNYTFITFAGSAGPVVPHPCIQFENNMYYGNGNTLLRQATPGSATTSTVLTLPANQTIVALGIDPGTGRMLISIIDGINASDTRFRVSRVGYYDGFSNKLLKVIIVDDMITAFYPVGAIMFIGYSSKLGIWNGAGIQFLRDLDVALNSTKLPYKQKITNIDDTLYVVEGHKILAYGEVIAGRPKCFYYAFVNKDANLVACDLSCITNLGSGLLGFGWVNQSAAGLFATLDTTSVSTLTNNIVKFYSKKYTLPTPITFNQVVIEYGAALPTSNAYADMYIINNAFNGTSPGVLASTQIVVAATNTTASVYEMPYTFPSITTRTIQLRFDAAQQVAIRRITFFNNEYD